MGVGGTVSWEGVGSEVGGSSSGLAISDGEIQPGRTGWSHGKPTAENEVSETGGSGIATSEGELQPEPEGWLHEKPRAGGEVTRGIKSSRILLTVFCKGASRRRALL